MQPSVTFARTACETAHKIGWYNLQSSKSLVLNELLVQVTQNRDYECAWKRIVLSFIEKTISLE
jgi:hypothetical protein